MSLPPPPAYFQQQRQAAGGGPPGHGTAPPPPPSAPFGRPPFQPHHAHAHGHPPPFMGHYPPPGGYGGPPPRPGPGGDVGVGGSGSSASNLPAAPTYVPPIPIPSEEEMKTRPTPTANCDPFDETWPTYNVFVGDMPPDFTEEDLYAAYQPAGPIHSVNVVRDKFTGLAKGYGFVNFLTPEAKEYALDKLKSTEVRGIPIRCFVSDSKNQLQIIGIPRDWSVEQVKTELERVGGPMLGLPIVREGGGVCHVNYINYRRAEKAMSLLSGKPCGAGGPIMNVSLAVNKAQTPKPAHAAPPATLFIKNIAASIDDQQLAKYFGKFATVLKATIVRDHTTNESKGFGFVELPSLDEATKALTGTHMTVLDGKMLSVEYAKLPEPGEPGAFKRPSGPPPIIPSKAPMLKPREPKSRHQNEGDGGFTNPRGFADAAIEVTTGLNFFDDGWTTENVKAAAAIAGTDQPPKAAPIRDDSGKIIAYGIPGVDDKLSGAALVAPPQGTPESTCRAQKMAKNGIVPQPPTQSYDWSAMQSYAAPFGRGPPPPFGRPY